MELGKSKTNGCATLPHFRWSQARVRLSAQLFLTSRWSQARVRLMSVQLFLIWDGVRQEWGWWVCNSFSLKSKLICLAIIPDGIGQGSKVYELCNSSSRKSKLICPAAAGSDEVRLMNFATFPHLNPNEHASLIHKPSFWMNIVVFMTDLWWTNFDVKSSFLFYVYCCL